MGKDDFPKFNCIEYSCLCINVQLMGCSNRMIFSSEIKEGKWPPICLQLYVTETNLESFSLESCFHRLSCVVVLMFHFAFFLLSKRTEGEKLIMCHQAVIKT